MEKFPPTITLLFNRDESTREWNQLYIVHCNTINVTHTSLNVDISLGLQQPYDNFKVTPPTGYVQCCPPILQVNYVYDVYMYRSMPRGVAARGIR